MKIINHLIDDQYPPFKEEPNVREIVRAVVLNSNDEVALTHLLADDMFGHRDYYELPGGGIEEGESRLEALQREIQEEVGYTIKLIGEIGTVIDYYNLLKRENHNHYYLVRAVDYVGRTPTENELRLIDKLVWVTLEQAIRLFNAHPDSGLAKLVKARELPVLLEAKRIYQEKLEHDNLSH